MLCSESSVKSASHRKNPKYILHEYFCRMEETWPQLRDHYLVYCTPLSTSHYKQDLPSCSKMPVMLQFVNLDYKISCFSWLVLVRTGHSSFLLADWSPSCSSGCGCWGFHTLDVQPPGACRPAARPYCRLPSASTSLTTAAHTILQLRNQMYWLKEEQGRKVYIESIKSLQPQTFRPQHKNCLVRAEMLLSRCRAVLWKTWCIPTQDFP